MIELDYDTTINFTIFENQYNIRPTEEWLDILNGISEGGRNMVSMGGVLDLTGYTFYGCMVY